MRLKLLIAPFLIVMMLILSIGYIQPDIVTMQAKKAERVVKQKQIDGMETLVQNIQSLTASLENKKESEQFVLNYLPETRDQARVIDNFNFSALQSGVSVQSMILKDVMKDPLLIQGDTSSTPLITNGGLNEDGTPIAPVQVVPTPKTFTATVVVRGTYENIKSFLARVTHMNRFHKMTSFSVAISKDPSDTTEGDSLDNLEGTFIADFDYMLPQKIDTALGMSVFERASLDMAPAEKASTWVTNIVPTLEKPGTGKPNPFQ